MGRKYLVLCFVVLLVACQSEKYIDSPTVPTATPSPPLTKTSTSEDTLFPSRTPRATINPFSKLPADEGALTPNPLSEISNAPWVWIAPNEKWAAVNNLSSLQIMHITGQVIWEIPTREMMQISRGGHWVSHGWSEDSKYFYFTLAPIMDPGVVFSIGTGLWRMNIISGDIEVLLEPREDFLFLGINISENLVAYIPSSDNLFIAVLDLDSKIEVEYQLMQDFDMAGNIVWNPSGDQLVYAAAMNYDYYSPFANETIYSFVLLDTENGEQRIVKQVDGSDYIYPKDWLGENRLSFVNECEVLHFDVELEEFVFTATVTPNPNAPEGYGCN